MCLGRQNFPFDAKAVVDALERRYEPRYVLAHGSAVRGRDDYNDIDIYAVCNVDYNRSFVELDIGDETIDVLINSPDAYRSYRDFYFWYPENLITEIGMFQYAVPMIQDDEMEAVREDIADPDDEVRFFIHTYHLGQLLRSREKKDWKDLWVHKQWSVLAVLSSYWNQYPQTVHQDEYFDSLDHEKAELLKPIRTESGFEPTIVDDLIELTTPKFLSWMESVRDGNVIKIHKRTQRSAINTILEDHHDRSPSDVEIIGSER